MINFSKLNLTEGMDPIEQSAADKATQSTDMKRDTRVRSAQQRQMAQKSKTKEKASMVYNEHKAMEVNRAYDRMKSDWRTDIQEHRGAPAGEEETTHPYVDVMPMTDQKEKRAKEQMDNAKEVGVENAKKMGMGEEFEFDSVFGKLVDEEVKQNKWLGRPYSSLSDSEKAEMEAEKTKNRNANRNNNKGQMDHSKKND